MSTNFKHTLSFLSFFNPSIRLLLSLCTLIVCYQSLLSQMACELKLKNFLYKLFICSLTHAVMTSSVVNRDFHLLKKNLRDQNEELRKTSMG